MRAILTGSLVLALAATVGCSSGGTASRGNPGARAAQQGAGWSGTSITSAPRNPTAAWTTPQGGPRFSSASTPGAAPARVMPQAPANVGFPARPAPPTARPSWTAPAGSPAVAPVPGDPAAAKPGAGAGTCGAGKG